MFSILDYDSVLFFLYKFIFMAKLIKIDWYSLDQILVQV
jgi:hypothetical protein